MNLANSRIANQTKSSIGLSNKLSQRTVSSLPTRRPLISDCEKSRTYESDFAENNNLQGIKKSRSPLVTSSSFPKSLNSKGETKKAPSMIPRSKSRRRSEGENFKFVNERKANGLSEGVMSEKEKRHKEPFRDNLHVGLNSGNKSYKNETMVNLIVPTTQKPLKGKGVDTASLSLKSCEDFEFTDIKSEVSELSYKDAQEEFHQEGRPIINITHENFPNPATRQELKEELEMRRQERIIRNLYETIKHVGGPLLDQPKWFWSGAKKENQIKGQNNNGCGKPLSNVVNIQHYYDHTIDEISEIWKDAVSLINSVRDHTLKFVEDKSKTIDKEQLILEAEMLQLAIDFAINYSKVKSEFMVTTLRKHFEVSELNKSDLEKFMDLKTIAALYNEDDLASMAQTVKELNTSVLKGEDPDLEFL